MRLSDEITYPDADVDAVVAMLADVAFQRMKCAASGALDADVEVTASGGGFEVLTRRAMPTDQIPDVLRSFVASGLTVVERTTWQPPTADGDHHGQVHVTIAGTPVTFAGRTWLSDQAGGAAVGLDGELRASVPLLGGKIEKAAEPALRAAIRAEERTGRAWLAGVRD